MSSSMSSSSSAVSSVTTEESMEQVTKQTTATCILDRSILNEETLPYLRDVGLSIYASACSKNRGAFVLDPPDGHTYG